MSKAYISDVEKESFWKIVEFIGWGKKDISDNHHPIKERLLKNYSKLELELFCDHYRILHEELIDSIKNYNKKNNESIPYGGGDSVFDNLSHIVGLGYEEYMRNIKNPKKVEERRLNGDYVEMFAYCFTEFNNYPSFTRDGQLGISEKRLSEE